MKTDLKLFRKNFEELKREGSPFVKRGRQAYLNYLKICVCTESFIQDGIKVEKGCTYGITNIYGHFVLYELTGIWRDSGHSGDFLSAEAQKNGIKGWNIYSKFGDNFKEFDLSTIYGFLYMEG